MPRITQAARDYIHQFTNKTADDRLIIFKKLDEYDMSYAKAKTAAEKSAIVSDMQAYVKKNVAEVVYVTDSPTIVTRIEHDPSDTKEIQDIKIKLALITNDNTALQAIIDQLNDEKKQLDAQIAAMTQQIANLTAENTQLKADLDAAIADKKDAEAKLAELQHRLDTIVNMLAMFEDSNAVTSIGDVRNVNTNIGKKNAYLDVVRGAVNNIISIYDKDVGGLNAEIKKLRGEQQLNMQGNTALFGRVMELTKDNKTINAQLQQQIQDNQTITADKKNLETQLQQQQDTNSTINAQLQQQVQDNQTITAETKKKIDDLQKQLDTYNNIDPNQKVLGVPVMDLMRGLSAALQGDQNNILSSLEDDEAKKLAKEVSDAKTENKAAAINALIVYILEKASRPFRDQFEAEMAKVRAELNDANAALNDANAALDRLRAELQQKNEELTKKMQEKVATHDDDSKGDDDDEENDDNAILALQNEIERLKREISELSNENETLMQEKLDISTELEKLKKFAKEIFDVFHYKGSDEKFILEELKRILNSERQLYDLLHTLNQKYSKKTKIEVKSVEDAIAAFDVLYKLGIVEHDTKDKEELETLKTNLDDCRTRLTNMVTDHKNELRELKDRLANSDQTVSLLQNQINDRDSKMAEQKHALQQLQEQLKRTSQELKEITEDLNRCERESEKYKNERDDIKKNTRALLNYEVRKNEHIKVITNLYRWYHTMHLPSGVKYHKKTEKVANDLVQLDEYVSKINKSRVFMYDDRLIKLNTVINLVFPTFTEDYNTTEDVQDEIDKAEIKAPVFTEDFKLYDSASGLEEALYVENWITKFLAALLNYIDYMLDNHNLYRTSHRNEGIQLIKQYLEKLQNMSDDEKQQYQKAISDAKKYCQDMETKHSAYTGGAQQNAQNISMPCIMIAVCCAAVLWVIHYCAQKMKSICNIPTKYGPANHMRHVQLHNPFIFPGR